MNLDKAFGGFENYGPFLCDGRHLNENGNNFVANLVVDAFRKTGIVPDKPNVENVKEKECEV
jgi:hypothetical protein